MLHKVLASLLALFTIAFCPAAFAGSYGEVQLAPSYKRTYRATTGFFTPAASATDVWRLSGNASNRVTVTRVSITGQDGLGAYQNYYLIKRSTAGSGGTAVTNTNIPLDSSDSAASSVSEHYTANPTVGTTVGTVATHTTDNNVYYSPPYTYSIYEANPLSKALTLRGVAEGVVLNLNGVTLAGATQISVTVEWTEE